MKIDVNDKFKFACVWLTNKQKNDPDIRKQLEPLMSGFKARKYKFVVFESGERNLEEQTAALLSHNKKVMALER